MAESIKIKLDVTPKSALGMAFETIPGSKYHRNLRVWEFPAIYIFELAQAVENLYPKLSSQLHNHKAFHAQRMAANKANEATAASRKATSNLKVPAPKGESYKEYQLACVEYVISRQSKGALVADDMGLGKTIETIAVFNYLNWKSKGKFRDMLIVCPAPVKFNWEKECEKWIVDQSIPIQVLSGKNPKPGFEPEGVCIINYDILLHWYHHLGIQWDMFVADESTYFKNEAAKRTIRGLLLAEMSEWKLFLTGTPIERFPAEAWTSLHTIDPTTWNNRSRYLNRYCDPKANFYSGKVEYVGATNVDELGVKMRSSCMIRRMKVDVAKELPPKIIQTVPFQLAGSALSKDVAKELARWKAAKEKGMSPETFATAMETDSSWAALRQKVALAKLPSCLEFIEDLLLKEAKVVLFAHHNMIQEKLAEYFKGRCCLGKLAGTPLKRQQQVDKFNSNSFRGVFVGSLRGDKMGINLQTAQVACFIEQDPVPGIMEQAEDRVYRQGQKGIPVIYNLVLEGSLDEELAKTRKNRADTIKMAMA